MLEATVTLNLKRMLHTEAGLQHLEAHMEKEYSKENLTFWQATRTYRTATDRRAEAQRIVEHYVRAGSEEEVNLPASISHRLIDRYDELGGAEPPEDLFAAAEDEIFKLMERDAYARFKSNPEAVGAVVDDFFAGADVSQDGYISFEEYRKWVLQQPEVIVFFTQLSQSTLSLLKTVRAPSLVTLRRSPSHGSPNPTMPPPSSSLSQAAKHAQSRRQSSIEPSSRHSSEDRSSAVDVHLDVRTPSPTRMAGPAQAEGPLSRLSAPAADEEPPAPPPSPPPAQPREEVEEMIEMSTAEPPSPEFAPAPSTPTAEPSPAAAAAATTADAEPPSEAS